MAYEKEVSRLINESLGIATAGDVSDILLAWYPERHKSPHSRYVQAQKSLQGAVDLGWLEKGANGHIYYKKPGLKSKHEEHSKALTQSLTSILCKFRQARVFREILVKEIGTQPDAIVLVNLNGRGKCFILEVVNHETESYLSSKVNKWTFWNNALPYLSQLFQLKIPTFDFVSTKLTNIPGVFHLDSYLEKLRCDS